MFIEEFWGAFLIGVGLYSYYLLKEKHPNLRFDFFAYGISTTTLGLILLAFAYGLHMPVIEIFTTSIVGVGGKLIFMFWALFAATLCSLVRYLLKRY